MQLRRTETDELSAVNQERSVMELEHIGVYRLYELALNLEMFNENDLHHLDLCTECLEVFKAISQYNRLKADYKQGHLLTTAEHVS